MKWFQELPFVAKALLVGSALLVLFVLLSPIAALVAALTFGISLLVLIVRTVLRKPIKRWGVAAAASFALMFAFSGISDTLYGTRLLWSLGSGAVAGDEGVQEGATPAYGAVAPGLEEVAERWYHSEEELPLLLPEYLPFPVLGFEREYWSPSNMQGFGYEIDGPDTECWADPGCSNSVQLGLGEERRPAPPSALPTIDVGGRSYHYDEQYSNPLSEMDGTYTVVLWVPVDEDSFFPYEITMTAQEANGDPMPSDEFVQMVMSLKRIDPSG